MGRAGPSGSRGVGCGNEPRIPRLQPWGSVTRRRFLAAAGCGKPFPKDLLAKVEQNVSYQEFQDEPERYDGKLLMFGGEIVDVKRDDRRDG